MTNNDWSMWLNLASATTNLYFACRFFFQYRECLRVLSDIETTKRRVKALLAALEEKVPNEN